MELLDPESPHGGAADGQPRDRDGAERPRRADERGGRERRAVAPRECLGLTAHRCTTRRSATEARARTLGSPRSCVLGTAGDRTLAAMRRPTTLAHVAVGLLVTVLLTLGLAACGGGSSSRTSTGASATTSTAPGTRAVSGPLVGVMFDGPALGTSVNLGQQLDQAVSSGVESVRLVVDWSRLQPSANGPIQFAELDRIVADAAARGLTLLPVVERTPSWDAAVPGNGGSPPRALPPFAAFLSALVHRYGSGGSFWQSHPNLPRVPIRMWQIWNEPHFTTYWSQQPFAHRLREAARRRPHRDQGRRPGRQGRARRPRRLLVAVPRADLPRPRRPPAVRHRRAAPIHGGAERRDHDHAARAGGDEPVRRQRQTDPRDRDHVALVGGQGPAAVRRLDDRGRAGGPARGGRPAADGEPGEARTDGLLLVHVDGR